MQNISSKVINYKSKKRGLINFFSRNKKVILPFIFILSFSLLYFIVDFSSQGLVAHDEGLYARRSRLVEESYNWFSTPFPEPHHKTLGSYWFIALSIRLFGNSEIALRLPSILASFLCLFSSYFIALKVSTRKAALISVFSLSSMPLWIQYSRYASPDMPFVLCILLVILFFLNFLSSTDFKTKIIYIFLSGLFISTAFFIRSYMLIVPLLGLSPFLIFHLSRSQKLYKSIFITGILFGSIPSILNLYFSYNKFGIKGITLLFDFAKDKAIGGSDLITFLFIPLNYFYLTFPVGFIIIILTVLTRSRNNINYPLLIFYYPLISFLIILAMSTSYPHYYLFLLPPLSILFGIKLESYSFRFQLSKKIISYFLLFIMILIICLLLFFTLYYKEFLIELTYRNNLVVFIISIFLVLSFIFSLRYLFDNIYNRYHLLNFFYSIIIPQYISLSLLYNFGIIGNPNFKLKSFLRDKDVSLIVKANTIYLYNVDSKINTLLRYYLPSSMIISSSDDILLYNYIITSDRNLIFYYKNTSMFKLIKNFDNHYLLMNIAK